MATKEQYAVNEFAQALLVIPRTLAMNAAKDAAELTASLRSYHHCAQLAKEPEHVDLKWLGLDLSKGEIRDNKAAGVFEPTLIKTKVFDSLLKPPSRY